MTAAACGGGGSGGSESSGKTAVPPQGGAPPGRGAGGPPAWVREATATPRGLVGNERDAASGYVLFTTFRSTTAHLVDREGLVVHTWTNDRVPLVPYLQDNGDLIQLALVAEPPNFRTGGVAGYIQRVRWDGGVAWEWRMSDDERTLHHDIEPLPNGNILAIAFEAKTAEEARAAGRRVDLIPERGLWSEWILEIEPLPGNEARIVWEWHVWDHLVQSYDSSASGYGDPAEHPRRLDINADAEEPVIDESELEQLKALGYVPDDATAEDLQSDFLHMNAIDYHPGLDQIAVSVPGTSEIWILDHSTTTEEARGSSGGRWAHGGDLLYRWGNPKAYGRGGEPERQLFAQHDVRWIHEGSDGDDGAARLTAFNNGNGRPDGEWSSVVEVVPTLDSEGAYRLDDDEAFGPDAPAWAYGTEESERFFAPFISGAHRLPNGNTFICSGPQGRYFEVTPNGDVVWEYRNPFNGTADVWAPPGTEDLPFGSFRAVKIPADHPGLAGRELAPHDPQPAAYERQEGRRTP